MAIKLNHASLGLLPSNVAIPKYEASQLRPGIVHIGVGNFHRAHQMVYLDRLFNLGLDLDWGLIGAGIMPSDAMMRKRLESQDWLTTVIDLDEQGLTARVCAAMTDFVATESTPLIDVLTRSEIRIVSLTITEGGYFVDEKTGGFCSEHVDIKHDIEFSDSPKTVFGILLASLRIRRKAGDKPFTIMSCDNVPNNGRMTKQALLGLARSIEPDLADWIEKNGAFPNSMVDCITPATTDQERFKVQDLFGVDDAAPVFCEPFRQWVLEDDFVQGRPALEKVGVEFVDDVAPYELMKLRILNGGHAAIAFPAALLGIHYVHDAMNEPVIRAYLAKIVEDEVIPTLPPVPGVKFSDYFKQVEQRFLNPEVGDTISRLCCDSSNRLPKFILPIIAANIESNRSCPGLIMVVAFWCLYCASAGNENNTEIDITLVDQQAEKLKRQASIARENPLAFLEMEDIFGALGRHPMFVKQFTLALNAMSQDGVMQTLGSFNK